MSSTYNRQTVIGVFHEPNKADEAYQALREAGFGDDQLGIVSTDTRVGNAGLPTGEVTSEVNDGDGAAAGAIGGGVVGGIVGAAASLLIPGIGPVVAGGILLATLTGAVIGAAAGGMIGAFTNLGFSEEDAHYYEQEFKAGRTILTVHSDGRPEEATSILRSHGAYDAHAQGQVPSTDPDEVPEARP